MDPADLRAPVLANTTTAAATPMAEGWLEAGWTSAALPAGWEPFTVTGGQPNTPIVAGRFWISPAGFTPVDAAAVRVGDARYDEVSTVQRGRCEACRRRSRPSWR